MYLIRGKDKEATQLVNVYYGLDVKCSPVLHIQSPLSRAVLGDSGNVRVWDLCGRGSPSVALTLRCESICGPDPSLRLSLWP